MKCKVFITDEGFGPIVRQSAIVEEIRKLDPSVFFEIQTQQHFETASRVFSDAKLVNKYNNISWFKENDGSPDLNGIKAHFKNYIKVSDRFIKEELADPGFDFIISDYVYEAFEVAHKRKIPSFGVAHFTWDWFFSKLYPPPLKTMVVNRFLNFAGKSSRLYFPPFTPEEILKYYGGKAKQIPLIVRKNVCHKSFDSKGKFKILIIDSGAGVLGQSIQRALTRVPELTDYQFFVSSVFNCRHENVTMIDKEELFVDYINGMDLVIGRAGFNTISECIAFKTPMLLLSEAMNPEMNENIINIKKMGLGSFISLDQFENSFDEFLTLFLKYEYKSICYEIKNHSMPTNGAEVVAKDILTIIND